VRQVLRFIGVDESIPIDRIEANPTVRVRSPRLHEALLSVYLGRGRAGRAAKRTVKGLVPKRLRGRALRMTQRHVIFGKPQAVDDRLTRELRVAYKGEVEALSEFLGRDLVSLWGYDQLC
jgi:hypothetical protein